MFDASSYVELTFYPSGNVSPLIHCERSSPPPRVMPSAREPAGGGDLLHVHHRGRPFLASRPMPSRRMRSDVGGVDAGEMMHPSILANSSRTTPKLSTGRETTPGSP